MVLAGCGGAGGGREVPWESACLCLCLCLCVWGPADIKKARAILPPALWTGGLIVCGGCWYKWAPYTEPFWGGGGESATQQPSLNPTEPATVDTEPCALWQTVAARG